MIEMKKIGKVIAISVAIVLIIGLLILTNAFVGNPISKIMVTNNAQKYIEATYPNTDYEVERVVFNFKTGGYTAYIQSLSSQDTYFDVDYSIRGKIKYDNFSTRVSDGFNTWQRINSEYREVTDEIIEQLPYETDIEYGEIQTLEKGNSPLKFGVDMASLELDKLYDTNELGRQYGKITLYVNTEEVTPEKAAEVLQEVKKQFDEHNQSFYAIDLVLRYPRKEEIKEWQDDKALRIECFLYSDIVEEGLLEKIEGAIGVTEAYYKEMDAIKQIKEKEAY